MAISGAGLQSIYQRLNSAAEYHPLEADTFADWSLEAGDIVTVTRDGTRYESPVHNATHVWKGQQIVRIASGGDEKRESVARMSRRKYAGSGSGVRSGQMLGNRITIAYNGLMTEIVQTESEVSTRMQDMYNGLESYVVQTASVWGSALEDAYRGLNSLVVQTASMWSSQLEDKYNGLNSKVEQTASHWSSELGNAYQGLSSKVEQTASSWTSQLNNAYQGLSSKVEQTSSNWTSQLNNAYQGLSSKVEQTASAWNVALNDAYNGLSSSISTQAGRIDAEAAERQSNYTELKGRVIVEAGKASLVAEITDDRPITYFPTRYYFPPTGDPNLIYLAVDTGVYFEWRNGAYRQTTPGKTIKATAITTAINQAGESEAHIDANKVYIGTTKSTTVIQGKVNAEDLTVDWLKGQFASIDLLNVQSLATNSASGTCSFDAYYGNHYYLHFPGGGGSVYNEDMRTGIKDVQITGPTNNVYKLQYKRYGDSAWRDADVSFSRATSLGGAWSGRRFTVTASPQGTTISRDLTNSSPFLDSSDNRWKVEVYATIPGTGTPPTEEHFSYNINVNSVYTTGHLDGFNSATPTASGFTAASSDPGSAFEQKSISQSDATHWYTYTANASNGSYKNYKLYVDASSYGTARYSSGWTTAAGKVVTPTTGNTSSTLTITYPNKTTANGTDGSIQYTVSADNNYAYITAPGGTVVARASHSAHANGFNSVTPTASGFTAVSSDPGSSFEQKSISQSDATHWYTYTANANNGNYKNYKLYVDASSYGSARYSSGWTTAAGKVVTPTTGNTSSTLTITYPNKTTANGSDGSIQYTVSADNDYAYIKAPGGVVVARASHSAFNNGKSAVNVTISPSSNQSLNAGGSVTVYARKDGTNIASISVSANSVATSCTTFSAASSEPPSSTYTERSISVGHGTSWFTFSTEGTNGGTTSHYKLKVSAPAAPPNVTISSVTATQYDDNGPGTIFWIHATASNGATGDGACYLDITNGNAVVKIGGWAGTIVAKAPINYGYQTPSFTNWTVVSSGIVGQAAGASAVSGYAFVGSLNRPTSASYFRMSVRVKASANGKSDTSTAYFYWTIS